MNYQVQRRKLLKIMAISAAAPVLRGQSAPTADQLKFFEPNQERTVDRLSEMIIPTDEHSPGASTAQVSLFIDEGLADGKEEGKGSSRVDRQPHRCRDRSPFTLQRPVS